MHLLIDIQALQSPESSGRGIGRYSANLVSALAEAFPDWRIELVTGDHLGAPDAAIPGHLPRRSFEPPFGATAADQEANERYYADWLTFRRPDAVLILNVFDHRVLVPRFSGPHPRAVAVLYDLIPLLLFEHYLHDPREAGRYALRFRQILRMDGIVAISWASADDLKVLAGAESPPVEVIGGAPDPFFASGSNGETLARSKRVRQKFRLDRDFILYVGGYDFRKNLTGAMAAFAGLPAAVRAELDLVIACRMTTEERQTLRRESTALGIADHLKITGFVSDSELRSLYASCRLFFFPSLYEGLGLPVLEALAAGAPVVASTGSSIPEVAGTVCRLVDPRAVEDMSEALRRALSEPREHRSDERRAHVLGFTWESVARRAGAVLARCAPRPAPGRRRRLAWVSPFPPARSGIAAYSAGLVAELGQRYEIELVVDPSAPPVVADLSRRFPVLDPAQVAERHEARPFDLFVYQIGNSHCHTYMLELMARCPGLVILHEIMLGGLVLEAARAARWPTSFAEELEREDPSRAAAWRAGALSEAAVLQEVPFTRRILAMADGIGVHSAWALDRLPVGDHAVVIPAPAPLVSQESKLEARQALGLNPPAFVIVSAGTAGERSRLAPLLRAAERLSPDGRPGVELCVVGRLAGGLATELRTLAAELRLGANLRFCGRVSDVDFARSVRAADVCVQLRYPSLGETSAVVLLALASGTPCIVSADGPCAELPEAAAIRVRTQDGEIEDLTAALACLRDSPHWGAELSAQGRRYVEERHALDMVARRYADMIESCIARRESSDVPWLEASVHALASCRDPAEAVSRIDEWAALRAANPVLATSATARRLTSRNPPNRHGGGDFRSSPSGV